MRSNEEDRRVNKAYLESTKRKCHDCGKPTWNYRCPECHAKFLQKNGILPSVSDADD